MVGNSHVKECISIMYMLSNMYLFFHGFNFNNLRTFLNVANVGNLSWGVFLKKKLFDNSDIASTL